MENSVQISKALVAWLLGEGATVIEQATDAGPVGSIVTGSGAGAGAFVPIDDPDLTQLEGWMRNSNLDPEMFWFQAYEEVGAGTAGPQDRRQYLGVVSDFYRYGALHNLWSVYHSPQSVATEIAGEIAQITAEGAPAIRAAL
jgi:hypothetical protein